MPKETSDDKAPKFINDIKSTIRPFLTYIFTSLFLYVFFNIEKYSDKDVDVIGQIMFIIIVFWFGERLIRNTGLVDILKDISFRNKKEDKNTSQS